MPTAVLIGPPGSGKSSVGRSLAKALGTSFIDTDSLIEEVAQKPIKTIFAENGEEHFRAIEEEVILGVLASEPGVVALGGGSLVSEKVCALLHAGKYPVIYLTVSAQQAVARVSKNDNRPLLAADPESTWIALLAKRESTYESLADVTVATDSKKATEIAAELQELLGLGERYESD